MNDPEIDPEANQRHDLHHPPETWDIRVRGAWNETKLSRRGYLTDQKIAQYEKLGYYSQSYRDARKAFAAKRARAKRVGNFIEDTPGHFVYSPR